MRVLIETFDSRFVDLKDRSIRLLHNTGTDRLYRPVNDGPTVGHSIIRSAGFVEQMIGGITRRLWDDPFEWTLRERMHRAEDIVAYLEEVEVSRKSGFEFFTADEDLARYIPAPIEIMPLFEVLLDALVKAEGSYAKAEQVFECLKD